MESAE
jgi:ATP-dependent RNA helicase DDX21